MLLYLACSPETVEGILFIETVLPLHWRSANYYIATVNLPGRKQNYGLAMVSTLIASRWSRPQSQKLSSLCWPLMLVSAGPTVAQLEVLFSSNSLCEPFSLFQQIMDSLFLCGNVLHQLEIFYTSLTRLCFKTNLAESRAKFWRHNAFKQPVASAAVRSFVVILSLLNAHNFLTRWYTCLIKFCIRIHFNIVQTLACVKVSFSGQGYAEHQSGKICPASFRPVEVF